MEEGFVHDNKGRSIMISARRWESVKIVFFSSLNSGGAVASTDRMVPAE